MFLFLVNVLERDNLFIRLFDVDYFFYAVFAHFLWGCMRIGIDTQALSFSDTADG
jgi:hypothetical protein